MSNNNHDSENIESQKKLGAKQKFTISYDMPETEDHTIDAVVLGKSLISMAELIKESDKILNGEHSEVQIDVKANKEGSFAVEFVAWLQEGGIDVLKTIGITAASTTAAGATLFGIVKHLRSRKIQTSLIQTQNGFTKALLTLEDGTQMECDPRVKELLSSHSVRSKLATVIEQPAKNAEGAKIKVFSGDNDEETFVIEQEDVPSFKAPTKRLFQETEVTNRAANVVFIQINNSSRNGWRALIRDEEFAVKMDDEGFMERMNAKQDFPVKDEMFEVDLETTKKIYDGKTSYSYRITEVKRHRTTQDRKIL
ncbi:hypothetical protein WG68_13160 [Arsukibacterium ikkense]|uniref:Uncharacterized protein n=1 Tax=Arsukibacterium ikkense TaxID=336831 RepID=A0A0M2V6K2_9GAMM|nr:hypothetical protein [Arsukibacterium ikkense]KKO44788.1 hypothetical protein WG68_13160 [Arsukibacterium ikkense]